MPKCGSTALQVYFRANQSALLDLGIDYPPLSPGQPGNMTPYAISGRPYAFLRWFRDRHPHYDHSRAESDLRAALEAPKAPAMLLSSEALAIATHRVDIDWIRDYFDTIHVHIFLRPRAALYVSGYEQEVRVTWVDSDVTTFIAMMAEREDMRFALQMAHWQRFVGNGRVHVYFVSRDRPAIDVQLLDTLGLDPAAMPHPITRVNEARSAFVHCVMAHCKRRNLIDSLDDRQRAFTIAERHDPAPGLRLLTPELARQIDTMFADDTEKFVAMQDVISRQDLETDITKLPPSTTFAEIEALPGFELALQEITESLAASGRG